MRTGTSIGVVGSAIHAPRAKRRSLEEAMYAVRQSALADAGLAIDDIDGIVVAANDQLDGRAISIMMASGSVGGVGPRHPVHAVGRRARLRARRAARGHGPVPHPARGVLEPDSR